MRPKSFILLILALGCGLIAAVGINQVLANRGKNVVIQTGEMESIFVVMTNVEPGARVTPEVLKLEPWPKDRVPVGAIVDLDQIEGRRTRTRLFAGEPVLEAKLFGTNASGNPVTVKIPKGYRVESVKVDAVAGGSNLIVPGDRVDVMVYLKKNTGTGIDFTGTRTILQNVAVFAINDRHELEPGEAEEGSIQAKTVSLLLLPGDAELLQLASELGKIRLALRSPEDDEIVPSSGTSVLQLLTQTGDSNRDDEIVYREPTQDANPLLDVTANRGRNQVDPSMIAYRMVIIEGTDRWEQAFDRDGRLLGERPTDAPTSNEDSLPWGDLGDDEPDDDSDEDETNAGDVPDDD